MLIDHLEMEIVLRKRPLKNKVQLFNFGKRMEPSAKVLKLLQRLINFCKSNQTYAKVLKHLQSVQKNHYGRVLKFSQKTSFL